MSRADVLMATDENDPEATVFLSRLTYVFDVL